MPEGNAFEVPAYNEHEKVLKPEVAESIQRVADKLYSKYEAEELSDPEYPSYKKFINEHGNAYAALKDMRDLRFPESMADASSLLKAGLDRMDARYKALAEKKTLGRATATDIEEFSDVEEACAGIVALRKAIYDKEIQSADDLKSVFETPYTLNGKLAAETKERSIGNLRERRERFVQDAQFLLDGADAFTGNPTLHEEGREALLLLSGKNVLDGDQQPFINPDALKGDGNLLKIADQYIVASKALLPAYARVANSAREFITILEFLRDHGDLDTQANIDKVFGPARQSRVVVANPAGQVSYNPSFMPQSETVETISTLAPVEEPVVAKAVEEAAPAPDSEFTFTIGKFVDRPQAHATETEELVPEAGAKVPRKPQPKKTRSSRDLVRGNRIRPTDLPDDIESLYD